MISISLEMKIDKKDNIHFICLDKKIEKKNEVKGDKM